MMDPWSDNLVLALLLFVLVTLPLLVAAARLKHIARILQRIESMNVHSLQRWQ